MCIFHMFRKVEKNMSMIRDMEDRGRNPNSDFER